MLRRMSSITILALLVALHPYSYSGFGVTELAQNRFLPSQITHDPLYITHDSDFQRYGFPGSGTEDDPYIIENLLIGSDAPSLVISYVSAYFVVRKSIFESSYSQDTEPKPVVDVRFSENGVFNNCLIVGGDIGISILDSFNMKFERLTISEPSVLSINENASGNITVRDTTFIGGGGIIIESPLRGSSNDISNCTIDGKQIGYFSGDEDLVLDASDYGQVILNQCENITIANMTSYQVAAPIQITGSIDCSVVNANVTSIFHSSIYFQSSTGITIQDSILTNYGIKIEGEFLYHWDHRISDTTVNGQAVQFHHSEANVEISNVKIGQLILVNCNNFTIENVLINRANDQLTIAFSSNVRIQKVTLSNSLSVGITMLKSESITVTESSITKTSSNAVYISDCSNVSLRANKIESGENGLFIFDTHGYTIVENSVFANLIGILNSEAGKCTIERNNITADAAIHISNGFEATIIENRIETSTELMLIRSSYNINITGNEFAPYFHGILIEDSLAILVTRSTFEGVSYAIQTASSQNVEIDECEFNGSEGIVFDHSQILSIRNSSFRTMYPALSYEACTFVNITGSTISSRGIILSDVSWGTIQFTNIIDCSGVGILMTNVNTYDVVSSVVQNNTGDGINVLGSSGINIASSKVIQNGDDGISLRDVTGSIISGNNISFNAHYGIRVSGRSAQNSIYNNHIGFNGKSNALDESGNNTWDDGMSMGNYWSDWNRAYIYVIPGTGGGVDRYPQRYEIAQASTKLQPTILASAIVVCVLALMIWVRRKKQGVK